MKQLLIGLFLLSFLTFSGCKKEKPVEPLHIPVCDGSSPTYDNFVSTLVDNNCVSCHGPGSSIGDWTNYTELSFATSSGSFEQKVLVDQTMPQGAATLTESELDQLKCWAENGYPEN